MTIIERFLRWWHIKAIRCGLLFALGILVLILPPVMVVTLVATGLIAWSFHIWRELNPNFLSRWLEGPDDITPTPPTPNGDGLPSAVTPINPNEEDPDGDTATSEAERAESR